AVSARGPATERRALVRGDVVAVVALLSRIGVAVAARDRSTLAIDAAPVAFGGIDAQQIRAADVACRIVTELLARIATDALGRNRRALGPTLVTDLALGARPLDPLPVLANSQQPRSDFCALARLLGTLGFGRRWRRFVAGTRSAGARPSRAVVRVAARAPVFARFGSASGCPSGFGASCRFGSPSGRSGLTAVRRGAGPLPPEPLRFSSLLEPPVPPVSSCSALVAEEKVKSSASATLQPAVIDEAPASTRLTTTREARWSLRSDAIFRSTQPTSGPTLVRRHCTDPASAKGPVTPKTRA